MAQQTAVNFLVSYMLKNFHLTDESWQKFEQAKNMEKEQIKTAFFEGTCDWRKPYLENMEKAEKYYNLTYSK